MVHLALSILIAVCGQPENVNRGGLNWAPTEPTVGDSSPIAVSQRAMPVDMRVGTNFDRLYKLNTRTRLFGGDADSDYYMRMNGGVTAVFPRSEYSLRRGGVLAEIPAGTVFSIGGDLSKLVNVRPSARSQPVDQPRPGSNFIDRSARPGPPPRSDQPGATPERPQPPARSDNAAPRDGTGSVPVAESARSNDRPAQSIWWDEAYRQQRVSALLDQTLPRK